MKRADLSDFIEALRALRKSRGMTQEDLASELGISRKTYLLFEQGRWTPQPRARPHLVKRLHDLHPPTAQAFLDVMGASLEDYVQVLPAAPGNAVVLLEPGHAKLVFDSIVLAAAEQADMSPRILRPILAATLERLAASGLPLSQAVSLAKVALPAPLAARRDKA